MLFDIQKDNKQQHLNLSNHAFYMLSCDSAAFLNESTDGKMISAKLINPIIINFYDIAQATTGISKVNINSIKKYDKNISFAFKLRDDTIDIINDHIGNTADDYYSYSKKYKEKYTSPGSYIKALLEEYARRPYYEREQIFFKKQSDEIRFAIQDNAAIKFIYRDKRPVEMLPYCIMLDEWSSYTYIIGISPDRKKKMNIRLAFISNLHRCQSDNPITKAEKDEIETAIRAKGVQFISNEIENIIVRLTPKGIDMYNHMIFMRPKFTSVKSAPQSLWDYSFNCTALQIEFYFFKFGAEAEVIYPEDLRQKFLDKYTAAVQKYNNSMTAQ